MELGGTSAEMFLGTIFSSFCWDFREFALMPDLIELLLILVLGRTKEQNKSEFYNYFFQCLALKYINGFDTT